MNMHIFICAFITASFIVTLVCVCSPGHTAIYRVCVYELGFTCKYVTLTVCVCSYR